MKIEYYIRANLLGILLFYTYQLYNSLGFGWTSYGVYHLTNLLGFSFYYLAFEIVINVVKGLVNKK